MKVLVTIGPISKTQLWTVIAYLNNRNLDQLSPKTWIILMTELAYSRKFKQWKNCNNYCGYPGGNLIVPFYIYIFEKNTAYVLLFHNSWIHIMMWLTVTDEII